MGCRRVRDWLGLLILIIVPLGVVGSGWLVVVCGVVGEAGAVIVEVGVVAAGRRFAGAGSRVKWVGYGCGG